jgi:hypothetical protein
LNHEYKTHLTAEARDILSNTIRSNSTMPDTENQANSVADYLKASGLAKELVQKHLAAVLEHNVSEFVTAPPVLDATDARIKVMGLDVARTLSKRKERVLSLVLISAIELTASLPDEESKLVITFVRIFLECYQRHQESGLEFFYFCFFKLLQRSGKQRGR